MVASVNGDEFLRDHTGDRRFWVVDLGHRVIDTGKISKDRDRIWMAVIAQFRQGLSPCLSHAEQSVSDKRNEGFRSENIFLSAVEEQCLGKLKARGREAGFDTRFAINESGVCEGRPPGQTEMRLMSQCLRELGFVQDRNATRDPYLGRSRKWRLSNTAGTSITATSVPSQSSAKTVI